MKNILEAIKTLHTRLQSSPWLTSVGVGAHAEKPAILIYATKHKKAESVFLRDGWEGFTVIMRVSGKPRAIAHNSNLCTR